MIRLLLAAAVAALLPACATAPPGGISLAYDGNLGPVPYRVAYVGGKAVVSVQLRPTLQK